MDGRNAENAQPDFPGISVVIPTLNSEKTLADCLESIQMQSYPGEVEVIIADGGSTDSTLDIASRYACTIISNPNRTGEAGKAVGLEHASKEVVALIDSDNILTGEDWFLRMTVPFSNPRIAGTEPIEYTCRPADPLLTRYCALLGMNDPICYFLKNYDRLSALSGTWTGLDIKTLDRGGYLEVELEPDNIPTIGANGFLVRRGLLSALDIGDYLFDIDVVHGLVERGHRRFAKVKVGIVHIYGRGLVTLARKQLRRVRDYRYYGSLGLRRYPWSRQRKAGLVRFIVYCLLVVPLLIQSLRGYLKKPDAAWILHAPACIITIVVYTWGFVEGAFRPREQERAHWSQ